ncbi:carbonic anhydrase [Neurospora tetraspora]|uniref:Carbonic anhydrase n=1 Tax=Neurospora tetraspora TaxID=94610 RepID=A0AAE0JHZ4_9PEZI|nr:carbonic anhydrase [Neurospora tetraspora]
MVKADREDPDPRSTIHTSGHNPPPSTMFSTRLGLSPLLHSSKQASSALSRLAIPTTTSTPLRLTLPSATPRRFCSSHTVVDDKDRKKDITMYLQETHDKVFENNKSWAAEQVAKDPDFFKKLAAGQNPEYLWIGCSDSRIPAEQITGLQPGDAFVHRNIANLVCNTDLNVMSVIEYAVKHLKVKHIVVCGHYGCGGVKAAMTPKDLGLMNPWLRNIRDVYRLHEKELDAIADEEARYDRLVELNVYEQCRNVVKTAALQQSYAENGFPVIHGWVFNFRDGLLTDLNVDFKTILKDIQKIYNLTD